MFHRITIHVLACLLYYLATAVGAEPAALRPNVLLIFTDDQGWKDVSYNGSEIPTPNIDSIAKNGLRFDSWYVSAPACTPSRFSLLTGMHPLRSQDRLLGALMFADHKGLGIRPQETTIAQVLKKQGYRTALIGKWHLGHDRPEFLPTRHGFDMFYGHTGGCIDYFTLKYGDEPDWYRDEKHIDEKGYATDLLTRQAVRYIQTQTPDTPFFLYLAYNAPHYGKRWDPKTKKKFEALQAQDKYLKRFEHIADPARRTYAAMVANLDDGIGEVLDALEQNTLVVFMSDNGGTIRYGGKNAPYRDGKATVFEGGIRVPCAMRWPGKIKPGTTTQQVGSALDIFPTLCHLTGASPHGFILDGVDLAPTLLQGRDIPPRDLFWTYNHQQAIRRGPWKYIKDPDGQELLFNIQTDPYEKANRASETPDLLAELRRSNDLIAQIRPPAKNK